MPQNPQLQNTGETDPLAWSVSFEVQKILNLVDKKFENTGVSADLYKKSIMDNLTHPGEKIDTSYYLKLMRDLGREVFPLLPEKVRTSHDFLLQAYRQHLISYEDLPEKLQKTDEVYGIYIKNTLDELGIYAFFQNPISSLPDFKKAKSLLLKKDFLAWLVPLDSMLISLYFMSPEQFKLLFDKNLLSQWNPLVFSVAFQNFVSSRLNTLEQSWEEQDIWAFLRGILWEYLWISDKNLIAELSTIYGEYYLTKLKAKKAKQQIKQEEKNKQKEQQEAETQTEAENLAQSSATSRLSYSHIWSSVVIDSPYSESAVHISAEEAKSASETALENFLYFESLMRRTKMDFLLKSQHRSKIQNATGVNFFSGEGMSEGRIFAFFSNIASRIGVPERDFIDEAGNTKVGQFYSLSDALMFFTSLAGSGYYKGEQVCDISRGENPVEEMLKKKYFIDPDTNVIRVVYWQKQ